MEKINITDDLISRLKEGALTNSEISFLLEYFKSVEPGAETESLFKRAWDESSEANEQIDTKWIYSQVLNMVNFSRVGGQENRSVPSNGQSGIRISKRFWIPALRYAAVFFLAFALFWLVRPVPDSVEPVSFDDQFQKVVVPFGCKTRVQLPDGSEIILNSGTNLSYSSGQFSSGERGVYLEGEGFFTVKKDPDRPFYVNTHGMRVKVLGTTFNIKAYPGEDTEEATLVAGSVEIYTLSHTEENVKPIRLLPNEKAVFSKGGRQIAMKETYAGIKSIEPAEPVELKSLNLLDEEKTEQFISWKDNRLIFDNEPLSSLLVKIERWYDVKIKVDYPELNSARFTGRFDKETVEQVMNALSTITPFSFEIRKNQITIMNKTE